MSTKTVEKQGLSLRAKKNIAISVIAVLMAALLAVSIVLIVTSNSGSDDNTDDNGSNDGTSTLTIKNGDFLYYTSTDGVFPKTANNWTQYAFKTPVKNDDGEVTSHGFTALADSDSVDKIVAGVISTDEDDWSKVSSDLASKGIESINNPGLHSSDLDKTVYMFATKEATSATIISSSFGVSSQTSAKITVWLNVAQLGSGKAFVVLQQYQSASNLSAMEKTSAGEKNLFAYEFDIAAETGSTENNGWIEKTFYIFNRNTSSKNLVVSVGIGNPYADEEETCEGILFVDDIQYETITANDYRVAADEWSGDETHNNYFSILTDNMDEDESVAADKYSVLDKLDANAVYENKNLTLTDYLDDDNSKIDGTEYSPFVSVNKDLKDNFTIYSVTNDGSISAPVGLVLSKTNDGAAITVDSEVAKSHLHISFWVRVYKKKLVTTKVNVVLQSNEDGEWTEVSSGAFDSYLTSQDIDTDSNNGWVKYDYYVKPNSGEVKTLRVVIALGDVSGYAENSQYIPNGTLYVTSPLVEKITSKSYSSASSGTYAKKISLVGNTASTSITNGSFSNVTAKDQPESWLAAFGGSNLIYKDGTSDEENTVYAGLAKGTDAVTSVVVTNNSDNNAPKYDDDEKCYLSVTNNKATAFGYLSADFTLSSKTVYSISVLAKTDGTAKPFIYLLDNNAETRDSAVIASITSSASSSKALDTKFAQITEPSENGWTRYYIVVVTGSSSMSVRLALFNGSIDGTTTQSGTVCYDIASLNTLGTYSVGTDKFDEDKGEDNWDNGTPEWATSKTYDDWRDRITYTATSGYTALDEFTDAEIAALDSDNGNVVVNAPDADAWKELVMDAYKSANSVSDDDTSDDTTTTTDIDWSLLTSAISSVALIGALLIVVVVRIFRKRQKQQA